jgi:hypothetical protein
LPTRLAPLLFAALLALALAATPALADPGPGSGHQALGGSGSSGPGPGHRGSDDRSAPEVAPPMGSVADQRAGLPRLSTAPTTPTAAAPARTATAAAPTPAAASPTAPTRLATSPASAATAGSPTPDLATVAGVAGGVLLVAAMVAAGFRARARLGRLG